MGMPVKAGIYVAVAVALGGVAYVRGGDLLRALLLAAVVLAAGLVVEGAGALQVRGVLPELRSDSYGDVQKPSWHDDAESDGSEPGGAVS